MAKGKKYQDAARRFDRQRQHTPIEALALVKSLASANFDESVEVAVRLGVDPRKADEMIRGTVALPAGTGRDVVLDLVDCRIAIPCVTVRCAIR